ncbi:MAG: lysoplasmalogenase [Dermatophilus congolensis]|nr:lysoplasmalogenase [Dermatophilus congolensis]
MRPLAKVGFGAYGAVVAAHLGAQVAGADDLARWSQWALMPVLAAAFVADAPPRSRLRRLVLAGVGFSWLGDTLPHFVGGTVGSTEPGITSFLVLVAMFAIAQALYAVAFWPFRRRSVLRSPWLIAYLGAAVLMVVLCAPGAGPLLPAIVPYALLIALMAALATGAHRVAAVGAILFMVSDSIIALGAFAPWWNVPGQGFWVMSTYAIAQALIVLGVLARDQRNNLTD